jgi:phosphoribosylglycinamide formyltransferase-1
LLRESSAAAELFGSEFVNHYHHRLVNIHPSLLPKFPGNNTHQRAIDAAEKWHGASVHYVVPEVDAGPIIIQGRIELKSDDSTQSLQQRIHKVEHQIYPKAIQWISQHRLSIHNHKVLLDNEFSAEQLQTFNL